MIIYEKNKIVIKDLILIQTLNEDFAVIKTKDNLISIKGENLEIDYLEYGEIHLLGIIKEIIFNEK